jgi:hypothetical protein
MIRFSCVNCGKVIQVKPEMAGRKGKCPGCQAILEIPAASTATGPSAPTPQQPAPTSAPPQRKIPPAAAPSVINPSQEPDDFEFDTSAFSASPSASSPFSPSASSSCSPSASSSYSSPRRSSANNNDAGLPLGLGIGSLALGVISLFFTCCLWFVQLPFAGVGLGLGIFGIIKSKGQQGASRVLPILGTIFSSIGLLLGIVTLILVLVGSQMNNSFWEGIMEEVERERKAKQEADFNLDQFDENEEK